MRIKASVQDSRYVEWNVAQISPKHQFPLSDCPIPESLLLVPQNVDTDAIDQGHRCHWTRYAPVTRQYTRVSRGPLKPPLLFWANTKTMHCPCSKAITETAFLVSTTREATTDRVLGLHTRTELKKEWASAPYMWDIVGTHLHTLPTSGEINVEDLAKEKTTPSAKQLILASATPGIPDNCALWAKTYSSPSFSVIVCFRTSNCTSDSFPSFVNNTMIYASLSSQEPA